ncbi:uncharacterized protein isoform X2 [Musca autumnalis]|uniref:uncharacterized protein isoform X2 n=1 Tax=Musca autumnalis TaxID=221902 RepID=UPI003CF7A235
MALSQDLFTRSTEIIWHLLRKTMNKTLIILLMVTFNFSYYCYAENATPSYWRRLYNNLSNFI